MYVCICKRVSEHELRHHVERGARSVEEVGQHCGAGTDCGSCQDDIADLIDELRAVPALAPAFRVAVRLTDLSLGSSLSTAG